ncbi:MAG: hypothetical protein WAW37_10920 [Syntrophobacteraceae bacterium]
MREMTNTILLLDDEPHCLDWLIDYLKSKSYLVEVVRNVKEAADLLHKVKYRAVIIDLNVPATGDFAEVLAKKGEIYQSFRGIYIAELARNRGHRNRQVIVYSVHESEAIRAICKKLDVAYLTKGRPRQFKEEIDDVLSFDPTQK